MSSPKLQSAILDVVAGTTLIMAGFAGLLVRLGVLDISRAPQWFAIEHWWPLLLIIVGLLVWLADMERDEKPVQSPNSLEMPYGNK